MDEATRREWRELGFYYDRDDDAKVWKLTGSRRGLLGFRDALPKYVADPRKATISEEEHYGPYKYLEVMTWPEPGFDGHAIRGSLQDLLRLADLIDTKLDTALAGTSVLIRDEFSINSPYSLILELRDDEFDPSDADPQLRIE